MVKFDEIEGRNDLERLGVLEFSEEKDPTTCIKRSFGAYRGKNHYKGGRGLLDKIHVNFTIVVVRTQL